MYTLHHYFLCPASRFVRIILEEKKIKFHLQIENYWDPQKRYLLMNPAGYFPILQYENNTPIVGSSVIMEYLENSYESNSLFNNQDITTLYNLGRVFFKLEDYKNAAKYFKSILKINPDHADSRFELISIYQLLNRQREANKECDILYMLDRELYYAARYCNM